MTHRDEWDGEPVESAIGSLEVAIVAALIGGVASYYWARREGRRAWLLSILGAILTFGIMRKFVAPLVDTQPWRRSKRLRR
ncbi:MAG TPA: hypothetical protein VKD28_11505 [Gemmatimonadales bacterium]|nr:hypothetical protein [Gemmatimonadales bacterium]